MPASLLLTAATCAHEEVSFLSPLWPPVVGQTAAGQTAVRVGHRPFKAHTLGCHGATSQGISTAPARFHQCHKLLTSARQQRQLQSRGDGLLATHIRTHVSQTSKQATPRACQRQPTRCMQLMPNFSSCQPWLTSSSGSRILLPVQLLSLVVQKSEALHQVCDQATVTAVGLEVHQQGAGGSRSLAAQGTAEQGRTAASKQACSRLRPIYIYIYTWYFKPHHQSQHTHGNRHKLCLHAGLTAVLQKLQHCCTGLCCPQNKSESRNSSACRPEDHSHPAA